jgi:acetyl esterase/lipase
MIDSLEQHFFKEGSMRQANRGFGFCAVIIASIFASSIVRAEEAALLKPPPGFATYADVQKAVVSGKVELIKQPEQVPEGIEEVKDIEYGNVNGRSLQLDLYRPKDLKEPAPALVFIHGGGWSRGNRQDYRVYVIDFAKRGYVTATISYRLTGEAKYPAQIEDAKNAIRFLRANAAKYGINPDKMAAIGGSAGGHLSMMVGYAPGQLEGNGGYAETSSAVQAVVNFYGPTDLTAEAAKTSGTVKGFFGGDYEAMKEAYEMASPIRHIDKGDPPTLVLHGTIDELVPVEQADLLVEALKSAGVPVEYERLEGWPHTMDMAVSVNAYCQQQIAKFLDKHLR